MDTSVDREVYEEMHDFDPMMAGGESAGNHMETAPSVGKPMFRKAIRWLVYVTVFLIPLWFLPFTADVSEFNKQILLIAAAGIGLILFLVDVIKSGTFRYKPSLFYFPVLGLVAASAISVVFSVSRVVSLFGSAESRSSAFVTVVSLAILFFLALNYIEDKGLVLKKIVVTSLALAFIFGVVQIFGLFILKGATFARRSFYSVGSLNTLGILAAVFLGLFVSLNLSQKEGEKISWSSWLELAFNVLRHVGLVLALFLVMFINWWPVWLVVFVVLAASVAFTSAGNGNKIRNGRMKLFAMPMAVIVLGVFLMLVNLSWTSLKSKLPVEVAPSQSSSWKMALSSLMARPLGNGSENFSIAYDKFRPAGVANSIFYQIRFPDGVSEASNIVVEEGVLGILALLALLWFYGKELVGQVKNGFGGNNGGVSVWVASLGLFVAYFLYPFGIVLATLLFVLVVLCLLSLSDATERTIDLESEAKYSFLGSLAFIVGLILVLVAGYFAFNNYISDIYLAKAQTTTNTNKAIEYYVASGNSGTQDARAYRQLSQVLLVQLSADLRSGPNKGESRDNYNNRIQNEIASAVNIAIRSTNVDPADSRNWYNRGLVYENLITLVGGADQAAINNYNESLARNPADPNTYLHIGNVYLFMADSLQRILNAKQPNVDFAVVSKQISGNLVKASESYNKAVSLYNNFGQAFYNLAVVYDRQNKLPDAIKQFEKLRSANQRDPGIAFQTGLLYYRNNQKNEAFNAWQQAVTLFPNYSNARWYLSLVYEERGDLANALTQVQEIEKFNPDNALVIQRLAQLRAGKRIIPPAKVLDQSPLNQ